MSAPSCIFLRATIKETAYHNFLSAPIGNVSEYLDWTIINQNIDKYISSISYGPLSSNEDWLQKTYEARPSCTMIKYDREDTCLTMRFIELCEGSLDTVEAINVLRRLSQYTKGRAKSYLVACPYLYSDEIDTFCELAMGHDSLLSEVPSTPEAQDFLRLAFEEFEAGYDEAAEY